MPDITSSRCLATVGSMDTFSHTEYLTQPLEYHSLLSSSSDLSSPSDCDQLSCFSAQCWICLHPAGFSFPQVFLATLSLHMWESMIVVERSGYQWVSGSPASSCINYGTLPGLLQMHNPNRVSGALSEAIISEYVWKCLQNHKSLDKREIFKSLHNGVTKVLG